MLVPHFIREQFSDLDRCYLSLLEIAGSHAHKLKPLIETLGLLTLVITDLDSIEQDSIKKVLPANGQGYRTGNETIKSWVPIRTQLDDVIAVNDTEKVKDNNVRVAYQDEISLEYAGHEATAIPYTFEDALVLSNIDLFKAQTTATGLIKKMADAVNKPTVDEACVAMFEALGANSKKAEMALELLYSTEPSEIIPPKYIVEGLEWLQERLQNKHQDFVIEDDVEGDA